MGKMKFYKITEMPIEMHRARIVQNINCSDIEERYNALSCAKNNMFMLQNKDIFLDMLTDSGVNAMSDEMSASMMRADDSYAGSSTFTRLKTKIKELFGMDYFFPIHQGRACENIIVEHFVKHGDIIPMNYYFDSIKEHLHRKQANYVVFSSVNNNEENYNGLFKGNFNILEFQNFIRKTNTKKYHSSG